MNPAEEETPGPEGEAEIRATESADLLPLVYDELRRLARSRIARESPGQTLGATALVHEAWLRLKSTGDETRVWDNRGHYFAAAAEAMRRILIDRARNRNRQKRGGDLDRTQLRESRIVAPAEDDELLAIDEALEKYAAEDPEGARLVKMRFFAGLTLQEIADVTGVSLRTVKRQWAYARGWLKIELSGEN